MECEEFILPDWSPPDDPVMLMMVVLQVLSKEVGRACSVREPIDSKVIVEYLLKSSSIATNIVII